MLEEIAQSVRRAKEAISLAGSLAHSDPDYAWNVTLEASDHCSEALADLARVESIHSGDDKAADEMTKPAHSHDAAAVYRLAALLSRGVRAEDSAARQDADNRPGKIEGAALSQVEIITHAADLCKVAVEEGIAAHSLATSADVRDAVWVSIMASVEALYALLLIGAAQPAGLNFEEGELDLAALYLVDEITGRVSTRVKRNHGEADAKLR